MLGAVLKTAPKKLASYFDRQQRRRVFDRAMQSFMRSPVDVDLPVDVLDDLVYGWNNTWSAQTEYIQAFLRAAAQAPGPILECGSGLSTLLLGSVAQRTGNRLWCLEHNGVWAEKVQKTLDRYAIDAVTICTADLASYGSYSWYAPPLKELPTDFALIICDGPPGSTPGGRYGLLPVLGSHCRPGCEILLDDANRPCERAILDRWAHELGTSYSIEGGSKQFGRVSIRSK